MLPNLYYFTGNPEHPQRSSLHCNIKCIQMQCNAMIPYIQLYSIIFNSIQFSCGCCVIPMVVINSKQGTLREGDLIHYQSNFILIIFRGMNLFKSYALSYSVENFCNSSLHNSRFVFANIQTKTVTNKTKPYILNAIFSKKY